MEPLQAATLKLIKIVRVMLVLKIHTRGGTAAPDYRIRFRPWGQTRYLFVCILTYHVTNDEKLKKLCDSATHRKTVTMNLES